MRLSFLEDQKVQLLFRVLDGGGEELRVVGGAIRNALLGAPVHEIDFACTATPEVMLERAQSARLRCIPTGIEHGTITILIDGTSFEVTTLREDVETDGRRAKVRFGRSFEHDALRRDFTMNSLSATAAGQIFDYSTGLQDIAARRVRFIGDAIARVREDYLRILRFFRFHAIYGQGEIDREAFHAAIIEREGMHNLSRERIRAELLKLLAAPRAAEVVAHMCGAGLLMPVLAGIAIPSRLARLMKIEQARALSPDPFLRLMGLCLLVREDALRLRDELRLSNAECDRARDAARVLETLHGFEAPPSHGDLLALLFRHGRQASLDGLILAQAQSHAPAASEAFARAAAFLRDTPQPQLPFSGADLLAHGLKPGPALGETLKQLQALWIRAGFPDEPATLHRLLNEALAQTR